MLIIINKREKKLYLKPEESILTPKPCCELGLSLLRNAMTLSNAVVSLPWASQQQHVLTLTLKC